MTIARSAQISLEDTPYYHCVARCVRRAFLCGEDSVTGQSYEHRKQWVVDRLKELSSIYSIGICAYAVMSNHYHVVLHVNRPVAEGWSESEVIDRWGELFNIPVLVQRYRNSEWLSDGERAKALEMVEEWRSRLMDVSWFMRCLNESIARRANAEDRCKGRFWEGRFRSQALLDQTALLTCMVYVDLNPVRAAIAEDLEGSDYTSIQERIQAYAEKLERKRRRQDEKHTVEANHQQMSSDESAQLGALERFLGDESQSKVHQTGIFFSVTDYLALVDWTGRVIREDKRGAIPSDILPILQKLGVQSPYWVDSVQHFGRQSHRCFGAESCLVSLSEKLNLSWIRGVGASRRLYA